MSRIHIGNFYLPALKYDHVAQSNIMELSSTKGMLQIFSIAKSGKKSPKKLLPLSQITPPAPQSPSKAMREAQGSKELPPGFFQ